MNESPTGRRRTLDVGSLAPLLARARAECRLTTEELAARVNVSPRSVDRWETGEVAPSRMWLEPLALALSKASSETWQALVGALHLPLEAMLAKVPEQPAKVPPPERPADAAAHSERARARLDDIVRAAAEDLDVSPRRVRALFAQLVVDLEKLGLDYASARTALLGRKE